MLICSSKEVSNYVQMVSKSACVVSFFFHKCFCLSPYRVADWFSSLSVCSLCYRQVLHHDLTRSLFERILIYSSLFHLVATVVLLYREIRSPFFKVLSGGNVYSVGQSMGTDGL